MAEAVFRLQMEHSFSHYILHLEQDFCVIPKDSLSG
jgi:hypothetical protein